MEVKLASRSQVRDLDRRTIEDFGLPGIALMETAGRAATEVLCERLARRGHGRQARVAILCGPGNNGGDGYVIARHLAARGHRPLVLLVCDPTRVTGDAAINLEVLRRTGAPLEVLLPHDDSEPARALFTQRLTALREAGFVAWVDALLGTGLSTPVRGAVADAIRLVNEARERDRALVLAVDTPSGLDVDTGQVLGEAAVQADVTVTFGAAKPGLYLEPGRGLVGELQVVDLGLPVPVMEEAGLDGEALIEGAIATLFPRRAPQSHKGSHGHVLVVAGTPGKTGAAVMAGTAALRAGAGLVTVGTHPGSLATIAMVSWELMAAPLVPETGLPTVDDVARLDEALDGKDVVAMGPGLGNTETTRALLEHLLLRFPGPLVLDADALNAAARDTAILAACAGPRARVVLTPHPGEMARLCACTIKELLPERLERSRAFAREHGVIVVLKTGDTIVAHPDGRYAINTSGTPALASAGTGDVLTGVIAGLIGQGLDPWDAARAGVFVHGRAGEHAAALLGQRATTARGVIDSLAPVLRALELTPR